MAIDQAPEHANAVIESGGGAIVITDDASPIRRWMVECHQGGFFDKILK